VLKAAVNQNKLGRF